MASLESDGVSYRGSCNLSNAVSRGKQRANAQMGDGHTLALAVVPLDVVLRLGVWNVQPRMEHGVCLRVESKRRIRISSFLPDSATAGMFLADLGNGYHSWQPQIANPCASGASRIVVLGAHGR